MKYLFIVFMNLYNMADTMCFSLVFTLCSDLFHSSRWVEFIYYILCAQSSAINNEYIWWSSYDHVFVFMVFYELYEFCILLVSLLNDLLMSSLQVKMSVMMKFWCSIPLLIFNLIWKSYCCTLICHPNLWSSVMLSLSSCFHSHAHSTFSWLKK